MASSTHTMQVGNLPISARSALPLSNSTNNNRIIRNDDNEATSAVESIPLINRSNNEKPPLAHGETDDDSDDDDGRETVTTPHPGVDDGFFDNKEEEPNPDVETFSTDDIPIIITSRAGPDGDSDEPGDSNNKPSSGDAAPSLPPPSVRPPSNFPGGKPMDFPFSPGFGTDVEIGSNFPDLESIPDVNVYQHKKTLAQGMMDLALLSANANQLRYVLESYNRHPYFYPSVIFISFSLILQIAVGIGLIWNATYNVKDRREICIANKINNFTIIGIFLVTIVNVFVSAFGVANPPTS